MAEEKCLHRYRATGILSCDLSRTDQPGSTYSAQLELKSMREVRQVEIWSRDPPGTVQLVTGGQGPSA